MKNITPKQKQIYDFIVTYSQENGGTPSLAEISGHFPDSLKYPSSAHYHIKKLQESGYLERVPNRARSIKIYADKFVKFPALKKNGMDAIGVPIVGSANAGAATIFAEENTEGYLRVSRSILSKKDGVFALRVEGDSMNKAKIDGKNLEERDFVLIDSEYKTAEDGDYVLSIIDGMANLKKFKRNGKTGEIKLVSESTNKNYKPIYISNEDDYMVNGKIIAVIKK